MRIGLDLDEVVADFFKSFLEFYCNKTGKKFTKDQFKEYKFWPVFGVTEEESIKAIDEFHEKHKIEEIEPIEGAVESISFLLKDDELFVITARPERFIKKVKAWIKHHLKTDKIKVIHSGQYYNAKTKADVCKKLKIDIMIEDYFDTAAACADNGIKVLIFDQPWNRNFNHKNITRVKNWKELVREVNKLRKIK